MFEAPGDFFGLALSGAMEKSAKRGARKSGTGDDLGAGCGCRLGRTASARCVEFPSRTAFPVGLGHHSLLGASEPGPSRRPQSLNLLSRLAGPSEDLFAIAPADTTLKN